ncbi:hypothetical protein [Streptomyces violaceusniger]|uniref:hypothetical protein n=1 Tax=Streptomyces violaceusniger TaxID=68280 RepID=UPI003806217E
MPHARKPAKADVHAAAPIAQEAADYLRTQEKADFADAVNVLIAFATATTPQYGDPALSLHVPVDFRDRVREQAKAEGVKNLQPIVLEDLKGFLAGEWEPSDPKVSPRGSAGAKASMSVRIPKDLVEQVDAMAEDFARERGWVMDPVHRLNARQIAIQALGRRFGVELEKPQRGWETDYQLVMDVPEAFRDFVRQAEPAADRDLSIVLRDAYARFLNGEWVPDQPQQAPVGQSVDKVRLTAQVNRHVWEQVKKAGADPEQIAARGYRLVPTQVALAAIVTAYDVPEKLLYPWVE